jgi:hypothetical protein
MQIQTLSAEQVRTLIEKAGVGVSFTKKTENVAARTNSAPMTIWRYLKKGTPSSNPPFFLFQLAYEYQIIERPEDSGAAFIL